MQINSIYTSANGFKGLNTIVVFHNHVNNTTKRIAVKDIKNYGIGSLSDKTYINQNLTDIPFNMFQKAYNNAVIAPDTLEAIYLTV